MTDFAKENYRVFCESVCNSKLVALSINVPRLYLTPCESIRMNECNPTSGKGWEPML